MMLLPTVFGCLVAIDSLVFILFALSFTHPKTSRDWRSFKGILSIHCRVVRGNVWVSVIDDLFAVGLAKQSIPRIWISTGTVPGTCGIFIRFERRSLILMSSIS